MPDKHSKQVIRECGDKNAAHYGLPSISRSKSHREQLRFVPHLGKDHECNDVRYAVTRSSCSEIKSETL